MKRAILTCICAFVLLINVSSLAFQEDLYQDEKNNGIIDLLDTGDYIVMIQVRLRELGYFHFKPTGKFQSVTRSAVIEFQKNQADENGKAIISDGTIGDQSINILFSRNAVRSPISQSLPIGPSANGSQKNVGEMTDWADVKVLLVKGTAYTLTDFNTGTSFQMVFTGGERHAEMECKSSMDTATYKHLFGGVFNYSKRPMLISVSGKTIACSLQGEPHGEDTVSGNDMQGHTCLFFLNSKSHVGALPDIEHSNNIFTATGNP